MDADAFLAAQLWLRPLPTSAWPASKSDITPGDSESRDPELATTSVGAADRGCDRRRSGVVLEKAKCCFLLEERPSTSGAAVTDANRSGSSPDSVRPSRGSSCSPTSQRRRPPLCLSTRVSIPPAGDGVACDASDGNDQGAPNDTRSPSTSYPEGHLAQTGRSRCRGKHSSRAMGKRSHGDVYDAVRAAGHEQREEREGSTAKARVAAAGTPRFDTTTVQLKEEFDFGLAIARGSPQPPRSGACSDTSGGIREVGGRLEAGGSRADESGGTSRPQMDRGSGLLLLQIEGKVYEADHTLIRSIAYPRGGGGEETRGARVGATQSDRQGVSSQKRAPGKGEGSTNTPSESRQNHNRAVNGAKGLPAEGGTSASPRLRQPPTTPSSAAEVVMAVEAGNRRNVHGSNSDGTTITDSDGHGGGKSKERPRRVSKRSRVDSGAGALGRGGRGGATHGEETAAAAAATTTTGQGRDCSRGGDDVAEVGMPFCGLFFPGVLIKFWLPRWHSKLTAVVAAGGDRRAEAVATMQCVVNDMMAGLSPTPRRHRLHTLELSGMSQKQVDELTWSAVADGRDSAFLSCHKAWDEFVHGSNFLLGQGGDRRHCERRYHASHISSKGSDLELGGPALPPSQLQCPDRVSDFDAPALLSLSAIDSEDAEMERGGLSDVGWARSLTSLAACFSAARLPPLVKVAAQRRLEEEATYAGRDLEDALDRAFPLDLSQRADTDTRISLASELETSLRRVQAARKAVLAVTLLPSSEILDG